MSADDADDADDAATGLVEAAAVPPAPTKKKRKRKSGISRKQHGPSNRKNSTTHHLPRPSTQSQAPNNNNDTEDTRVWNMKRTLLRRDKKIEAAANENKQLKRKIESVNINAQLVQQQCDKKVRDIEVASEKLNKRSHARMSAAAAVTTKAKAKDADATKAVKEASTLKRVAIKATTAVTKELKKVGKTTGVKVIQLMKQIKTRDEKICQLKEQLKESKRDAREAEKTAAKAQEEASKQEAARKALEDTVDDMEQKMVEMQIMIDELHASGEVVIKKESIKGTGFKQWSQKIVQLIMEYLVAGGAPSAFSKILTSFLKIMQPNSTIEELPSVWFIRRMRTVLVIVCQLMAAYRLAKAEKWGQLNCDETKRHQTDYLNLVLSCVEESCGDMPNEYSTILMSACILPEDGTSTSQRDAINDYLEEMNSWLDEWATLTEKEFPEFQHDIIRNGLTLSKLAEGGLVTQDTCNGASKGSDLIVAEIKAAAEGAGIGEDNMLIIKTYCHHHLRNIWWKWLEDCLSKYLGDALEGSLREINPRLRVSTKISDIIRAVDKEFALPANYPKGHGKEFLHWLGKYHPGALLVPTLRSAGSRHDLNVEGAGAIYYNRSLYIQFLDEQLKSPSANNILQENLFIILACEEMTALCRLCSIFHFAFSLPLRWLAGNTHELADDDWSVFSMSEALNTFEKAMTSVMSSEKSILDEDWVMNIFNNIAEKIPKFKEYLQFTFDLKKSPSVDRKTEVLSGEKLRSELFHPERDENKATDDLVKEMAIAVAEVVLKEMHDRKKHTWEHLDSQDGPLSMKKITQAIHKAGLGKHAVNDVAERPFGALTQQMQAFTTLLGMNAAAVGQARINGDFYRVESERTKKKKDDESDETQTRNGTFIDLPPQLLESAIRFAMNKTKQARKKEQEAISRQQEARAKKLELLKEKEYEKATAALIDALYYHDMFHSVRRWKTAEEVDEMLSQMRSNSAKLEEVKEQIRMRVLGFGWDDMHHPWSQGNRVYTYNELADHLKNVIIPNESKVGIPTEPPVKALERKALPILGTLSKDVETMNSMTAEREKEIRDNAEKSRDEQELQGFGDRYLEMQPRLPPPLDDSLVNHRIEICWNHGEQREQLIWHSGTVIEIRNARSRQVTIHYDAHTLDDGEAAFQVVKLLPTNWIKTKHLGWRFAPEEVRLDYGEI